MLTVTVTVTDDDTKNTVFSAEFPASAAEVFVEGAGEVGLRPVADLIRKAAEALAS